MRNLRIMAVVVATAFVAVGCHEFSKVDGRHFHRPRPKKVISTRGTWCNGLHCNKAVYIDSHCNLTDESGTVITYIAALGWTRICFFNNSGCPVVLRFDPELFGQSRETVSLSAGECVNLMVNLEAETHNYPFEIICQCVEGQGHTNPEVKVGDGEEEGGGG